MGDKLIKPHNFQTAISSIQQFSRHMPSQPSFTQVKEKCCFGLLNRSVTGEEFNTLVEQVQKKFVSFNSTINNIIKEFSSVYEAFQALDRDYINGIIGAVESAETASKQALSAQTDIDATIQNLKKTVERLIHVSETTKSFKEDIAQIKQLLPIIEKFRNLGGPDSIWKEIHKNNSQITAFQQQLDSIVSSTISRINNNITLLQQFNTKLEALKHLGDIDTIWQNVQGHEANLVELHKQLDDFIEQVNQKTARINNDVHDLQQFRSKLEALKYLGDIDTIWQDVQDHTADLSELHSQINDFIEKVNQTTSRINADINQLKQFQTKIEALKHIGDVDSIWQDVQDHAADLSELHSQINNFIEQTHSTEEEIKTRIHLLEEANIAEHLILKKKLKISYIIGGIAVAISLVHIALRAFGIF